LEAGVESFKGIPYAAPPIGTLRWRPPAPAPRWNGVRDGSRFGAACPQDPAAAGNPQPQAEDCLFLNVWKPMTTPAGGAPVMVWIHGGGDVGGAGSQEIYDGASFARDGVVTVSINYRLGALGFFAHPALWAAEPDLKRDGNFGVMDQVAALRWVRRNIRAFGGDPSRITLAGQSAGGEAVLLAMTMPSARGLFQRAIVESAPGYMPVKTLAEAEAQARRMIADAGLPADIDLKTLRALPPEKLLGYRGNVGPYVDGDIIKAMPLDLFLSGKAAPTPLLIGTVTDEGSLMGAYPDQAKAVIALFGDQAGAARDSYRPLAADDSSYARQIFADVVFGAASRAIARAQSARAPTYLYRFGYVMAALRDKRPGAWHVSDVPYEFETLAFWRSTPTAEDHAMAATIHACWVRFIAGRAMVCPAGRAWPRYTAAGDQLMDFEPSGPTVVAGYRKPQFDLIERLVFH
jgi:para-nitrobenzyl esterase